MILDCRPLAGIPTVSFPQPRSIGIGNQSRTALRLARENPKFQKRQLHRNFDLDRWNFQLIEGFNFPSKFYQGFQYLRGGHNWSTFLTLARSSVMAPPDQMDPSVFVFVVGIGPKCIQFIKIRSLRGVAIDRICLNSVRRNQLTRNFSKKKLNFSPNFRPLFYAKLRSPIAGPFWPFWLNLPSFWIIKRL